MRDLNPIFTRATFQFFRELARHNYKEWMDQNRERYRSCIVLPCRQLFEHLAPDVLKLDARFDVSGRTGANFSRINNDIRFSQNRPLYKTQSYVKFPMPSPGDRESGQLYIGISRDVVTAGFRIYAGAKRKESALAQIAEPRALANPKWLTLQKRRLANKYDSYWYSMQKGQWTKHDGWPETPEAWKTIRGWIVRRQMPPSASLRQTFLRDLARIFREVYPLVKFTSVA